MTTLKELFDDWHLIFDREIPRLREGQDVQMLWSSGHYDGPACGVCSYAGKHYWFDRISGGTHNVEYRGLEIANTIYVMVELTDADFGLEKAINSLFQEHVGHYCNYTYKVHDYEEDEREYTRVRGAYSVADTTAGYQTFSKRRDELKLDRTFDRYHERSVVGWWAR